MRYLITGGAGFIGSNLAEAVVMRGHEVRVLDNFSTGHQHNLANIADKIKIVDGDITDYWTVAEAVAGCDFVLHQAALPSVQRSVTNPLTSNLVNVNGTLNVLECARREKVKRVVFASSSSVYGESPTLPKVESMTPDPISPYAVSKLAGEHYCLNYWRLYGLPTVALRYFNIFGPNHDPGSDYAAVIPKFITAHLAGRQPVVYGDGEQSRDFTYVQNAIEANLNACELDSAVGKAYNVACGDRFTLNQSLQMVCDHLGTENKAKYVEERPGDIKHSLADIAAARADLDYHGDTDFKGGLALTIEWFREREDYVRVPV